MKTAGPLTKNNRRALWILVCALLALSCDNGTLGGADKSDTVYPGHPVFERRMSSLQGVWYSHYGLMRTDGYRIGKKSDFDAWGRTKATAIFPDWDGDIVCYVNNQIGDDDYIVLYDDTCYGMYDDGSTPQASWGFAYMGVVRAVNIFNDDPKRGAIIIEYIVSCDPQWLWDPNGYNGGQDLEKGEKPFFGIYYRELSSNVVQMANAVDLAALYAGEHYYTEKGTLTEAIASNTVEYEAEYISWGVVIPQDRER
jgi:hypothetical protein